MRVKLYRRRTPPIDRDEQGVNSTRSLDMACSAGPGSGSRFLTTSTQPVRRARLPRSESAGMCIGVPLWLSSTESHHATPLQIRLGPRIISP